jgi:GST-like protein
MAIVFYAAPFSSAIPVGSVLHELQLPHERINIDIKSNVQRKPEFLALNPNGKVPTLVADGTPMFETLAIVQWLGDRYGVKQGLWPAADSPARMTALAWTTWTYVTYGTQLYNLNLAASEHAPQQLRSQVHADHAREQLQQLLGILDAQLKKQGGHVLGKDFSLVDLLMANVVRYGTMCGAAIEAHPNVSAWLERINQRPSMRTEWG